MEHWGCAHTSTRAKPSAPQACGALGVREERRTHTQATRVPFCRHTHHQEGARLTVAFWRALRAKHITLGRRTGGEGRRWEDLCNQGCWCCEQSWNTWRRCCSHQSSNAAHTKSEQSDPTHLNRCCASLFFSLNRFSFVCICWHQRHRGGRSAFSGSTAQAGDLYMCQPGIVVQ